MLNLASSLARQLAANAEAFCHYYLSAGSRRGRYWHVGDVYNTPGHSLFVRLHGPQSGPGAAGHWQDAATSQHGDLLDLISLQKGHTTLSATLDEARDFLSLPRPLPTPPPQRTTRPDEAARRLFRASGYLQGTLGERHLQNRAITAAIPHTALRYHPRCYFRSNEHSPLETWPALIAAVTDNDGQICGAHRTYLARDGLTKAPFSEPRRAMGNLYGNGVRFGDIDDVMVLAEGLESTLSIRTVLPLLPSVAALSTSHLFLFRLPARLKRLYIAADNDHAGAIAAKRLEDRVKAEGLDCRDLLSDLKDWNRDLCDHGEDRARATLLRQLTPNDRERFASMIG